MKAQVVINTDSLGHRLTMLFNSAHDNLANLPAVLPCSERFDEERRKRDVKAFALCGYVVAKVDVLGRPFYDVRRGAEIERGREARITKSV